MYVIEKLAIAIFRFSLSVWAVIIIELVIILQLLLRENGQPRSDKVLDERTGSMKENKFYLYVSVLAAAVLPISLLTASVIYPNTLKSVIELKQILISIGLIGLVILVVFTLILKLKLHIEKA